MDDLLRDAASAPPATSTASRPAPSRPRPRRSRGSSWAGRCRRPDRSGRRGGAARRGRLAGDDGDRRRPLLRLRHRRRAAGRAGGELAGRRPGTRTPACTRPRRRRRARGGRAAAGCWTCCGLPAGLRRRRSSPARRWRNFTALAAARHAVLQRAGWDVEADGLFGAPPITVVVGDEAHPTLLKALGLLGLGRERVVRVPVDGQGRMRADALPPLAGPDDRLPAGRQREHRRVRSRWPRSARGARGRRLGARRRRLRPVGARPRRRAPTSSRGVGERRLLGDRRAQVAQRALRQRPRLRARPASAARGDGDHRRVPAAETAAREPSDYTPELSRRARGVEVWAALRSLGRAGLADLVERSCRHARALRRRARARPATRSSTTWCSTRCWSSFGDADDDPRA